MEILPYNWLLTIHIGSFIVTILTVIIADLHALAWWRGWLATLPGGRMSRLHQVITVGLGVSILSGALLFWPLREYLLTVPSFYTKMVFVAALCVNAVYIHRHVQVASEQRFAELTAAKRWPLFLSGAVSIISWVTVFVMARQLGL